MIVCVLCQGLHVRLLIPWTPLNTNICRSQSIHSELGLCVRSEPCRKSVGSAGWCCLDSRVPLDFKAGLDVRKYDTSCRRIKEGYCAGLLFYLFTFFLFQNLTSGELPELTYSANSVGANEGESVVSYSTPVSQAVTNAIRHDNDRNSARLPFRLLRLLHISKKPSKAAREVPRLPNARGQSTETKNVTIWGSSQPVRIELIWWCYYPVGCSVAGRMISGQLLCSRAVSGVAEPHADV